MILKQSPTEEYSLDLEDTAFLSTIAGGFLLISAAILPCARSSGYVNVVQMTPVASPAKRDPVYPLS